MKISTIAATIFVVMLFVVPSAMYVVNPFGTNTLDPRARIFGYVPYSIPSSSMSPTLQAGDYILVNAGAYASRIPEVNDVVVFKYPVDRNVNYVMRVVARGGERVALDNGRVKVDGKAIDQSYLDPDNSIRTNKLAQSWHVPEGHLFVLGDNRDNSNDSRYWGFVPIVDLVGRVSLIWMSDNSERIGLYVK